MENKLMLSFQGDFRPDHNKFSRESGSERLSSILVIDDEPVVRETLEALLGMDYQLYFAENGLEGLALAMQTQPDVILLDVMMPLMDGFEVCRQIRAAPALEAVPVLMITALDDRASRLKGLQAGVDDFLVKPFDSFELLARVQTITRLNRYRLLIEQRSELEKAHRELLISYNKTIEGWSNALDLRDHETKGHTQRVTQRCLIFARSLGLPDEEMEHIRMGALLHDVGKLGVPDSVLFKTTELTPEEWAIMRKHPSYAYEWLSPIDFLRKAVEIPYCHHEMWDGSGYPRGLRGEEIPLAARIFALVDVWDALVSNRPYRDGLTEKEALEYIRQRSGTHFDPALVPVFLTLFDPQGLRENPN
jgi:putative two-component system response regulator